MKTLICAVTVLAVSTAQAAIINVPGDQPTIQAGIIAANLGDEVVVAPGTYFEAINFLGKAITLRSSDGAVVTIIDGTGFFHVVQCVNGEGPDTVLDGFTITGGNANAPGGVPNSRGGGMYNVASDPTVTDCTFTGNSASTGGGMYNTFANPTVSNSSFIGNTAYLGGGMANDDGSGPTLTNCTFSGNSANNGGGGMFNKNSSPTVAHCTFEGNEATLNGGGMASSSSNSTVTNCTFSGNTAGGGGGMSNTASSPTVAHCTFISNLAGSGGGMQNFSASPTVTNCTFSGNTAGGGGGMSSSNNSSPTVTNCTFSGNTAGDGGGMRNCSSNPTVTNCTISGNTAAFFGGGMQNFDASPTVTNCTISGNTAASFGGGILGGTVANCVLWGNSPDEIWGSVVSYSNVLGGWPGTGNIDADPLFVSLSDCCFFRIEQGCDDSACEATVCAVDPFCCDFFWTIDCAVLAIDLCGDLCSGDFRLSPGSPCIDAGDNTAVPKGVLRDLDGNPRFIDSTLVGTMATVDMGAYEFQRPVGGGRAIGDGPWLRDVLTLLGWSAPLDPD